MVIAAVRGAFNLVQQVQPL